MSKFLFRPIQSLTKSMRSNKNEVRNDEVQAPVSSSSHEENVNPTSNDGDEAAATTTVSPPLEGETNQDETKNTNVAGMTNAAASLKEDSTADDDDKTEAKAPPKKKRRRRKRGELENLTWGVLDNEETRRSRRTSKDDSLQVTPSPSRKARAAAARNVAGNDNDAVHDDDESPRKRAAAKNVADENNGNNSEVIMNALATKKRAHETEALVAPSITASTSNEVPRKRRGRPPKSAVKKSPVMLNAEPTIRKRPQRNATKAFTEQSSYLYYDEDDSDDSYNNKKSSKKRRKRTLRRSTKRRVKHGSDDSVEDSDGNFSSEEEVEYNNGSWSEEEKLTFLIGLKVCGKSWSAIGEQFIKTRSPLQIKWYGGRLINQVEATGQNIFAPLKGKRSFIKKILSRLNIDAVSIIETLEDDKGDSDDEEFGEESNVQSREWSDNEHLLFLYGLQQLGRAKWQQLHDEYLPTRSRHAIRGHAQKYMKEQDRGENIFAQLKGKQELLDGLIKEMQSQRSKSAIPAQVATPARIAPARRPIVEYPPSPKSYNAGVVDSIVSAKVSAGDSTSAMAFCIDTLASWYKDAEEAVRHHVRGETLRFINIRLLRDEIAKAWVVYCRLTTKVYKQSGGTRKEEWLEVEMMKVARSCPLVGNHYEVIRACLELEFDGCAPLQTLDLDTTLDIDSKVVKNVGRDDDQKMLEILASAIDVCNDAVRKTGEGRDFTFDARFLSKESDKEGEQANDDRMIMNSMKALVRNVSSLRSLWGPSLHFVDGQSTRIICKQVNQLSKLKEALIDKSGDQLKDALIDKTGDHLGTEYGCDCWAIFATKRELVEHQKSCQGNTVANGERNRFEARKASVCASDPPALCGNSFVP